MRVAIAGAGKVGRAIARELVGNGHQVLLIDRDAELARPGIVEGAETLMADACEVSALDEVGQNMLGGPRKRLSRIFRRFSRERYFRIFNGVMQRGRI